MQARTLANYLILSIRMHWLIQDFRHDTRNQTQTYISSTDKTCDYTDNSNLYVYTTGLIRLKIQKCVLGRGLLAVDTCIIGHLEPESVHEDK